MSCRDCKGIDSQCATLLCKVAVFILLLEVLTAVLMWR